MGVAHKPVMLSFVFNRFGELAAQHAHRICRRMPGVYQMHGGHHATAARTMMTAHADG